mmetsp:Transcript_69209/g.124776  ORF Transcript_69209/g.124776 Transcript_69209/m.124776 type:complete len:918 (+) Transcript_69209:132-2885(+)
MLGMLPGNGTVQHQVSESSSCILPSPSPSRDNNSFPPPPAVSLPNIPNISSADLSELSEGTLGCNSRPTRAVSHPPQIYGRPLLEPVEEDDRLTILNSCASYQGGAMMAKALLREAFKFSCPGPARPGVALLLYVGTMFVLAVLDVVKFLLLGARSSEHLLVLLVASYLAAIGLPTAIFVSGIRQGAIAHPPPMVMALLNVAVPILSSWLRAPAQLEIDMPPLSLRDGSSEAHLALRSFLVATALRLLSSHLFPTGRQIQLVCFLVSSVALLAGELCGNPPPTTSDLLFNHLEGAGIWFAMGIGGILVCHSSRHRYESGKEVRKSTAQQLVQAARMACKIRKQEFTCWGSEDLFCSILDRSDTQQTTGRTQIVSDIAGVSAKVSRCYFLSSDVERALTDALDRLQDSIANLRQSKSLQQQSSNSLSIRHFDSMQVDITPMQQDYVRVNMLGDENSVSMDDFSAPSVSRILTTNKFMQNRDKGSKAIPLTSVGLQEEGGGDLTGGENDKTSAFSYTKNVMSMMGSLTYAARTVVPDASELDFSSTKIMLKRVGCWDFDVLGLSVDYGQKAMPMMATAAVLPFATPLSVSEKQVSALMEDMGRRYSSDNPYHNASHAADVMNSMLFFFGVPSTPFSHLNGQEKFAGLVAAAAHDMGHDGKSNRYHLVVETPLAVLYNDQSCLENMHCAILFAVLRSKGTNIIDDWSRADRAYFRSLVTRMILDTDLAKHIQQVNKFRDEFINVDQPFAAGEATPAQRKELLCFAIKLCDIGASSKPFAIHAAWAARVNAEFFEQGDLEREVGLPCSPFCDRQTSNIAEGQRGFYDFVVCPLYNCLEQFVKNPRIEFEVLRPLESNKAFWKECDGAIISNANPLSSVSRLVQRYNAGASSTTQPLPPPFKGLAAATPCLLQVCESNKSAG